MYTLTEKLWLNSDQTKIVPEGSPEAAWLLGPAGYIISDARAKALGLLRDPEDPQVDNNEGEGGEEDPQVDNKMPTPLPEGFPALAILKKAGITTYGQLAAASDLTKIKGIGEATAADIWEAFDEFNHD